MSPAAEEDNDEGASGLGDGQRLDKWLWFARVAKTRTLSAALVTEGKVRVNGTKVDKPAHGMRVGDAVTIVMRQRVRVLKVVSFAQRRGCAELAAALCEDLTPAPLKADTPSADGSVSAAPAGLREPGSGRPTKRQRREMDRFKFRST